MGSGERGAHVDFLEGHAERLGETLLRGGARLVLLLEVGFEDVMLLFREARLDFLADRVNRRLVKPDVWFGRYFKQRVLVLVLVLVLGVARLLRIRVGRHRGRVAVHGGAWCRRLERALERSALV